jgi:hypothetical protein
MLMNKSSAKPQESQHEFIWYDPGQDNPFNKRILDIRAFSSNITSATDKDTDDRFWNLRESDGLEFTQVDSSKFLSFNCNLIYPHSGNVLEGVLYKAKSLEIKWDIYARNSIFYFVHSLSGDLIFKAYANIGEKEIKINKIEYNSNHNLYNFDESIIVDVVHFIILSHLFCLIVPHPIPDFIPEDETRLIANLSFKLFGPYAVYATKESILDLAIISDGVPSSIFEQLNDS